MMFDETRSVHSDDDSESDGPVVSPAALRAILFSKGGACFRAPQPEPDAPLPEITEIDFHGDSLTDRGEWIDETVLCCIPGSVVTGLRGRSPQGSFTNGFAWSDFVATWLSGRRIIEETRDAFGVDNEQISEALITGDKRLNVRGRVNRGYNLDNANIVKLKPLVRGRHMTDADLADAILSKDRQAPKHVKAAGLQHGLFSVREKPTLKPQTIIRSYAQGGLTAADWKDNPSFRLTIQASRQILPTLKDSRRQMEADDRRRGLTRSQKAKILVTEWSGINDQITVNVEPSEAEVRRAVAARAEHARQLIALGYRQFVWFNQPDLSLTPRFQARDEDEQENAQTCSALFNRLLEEERQALCRDYPYANVQIFDVASIFNEVYHNPERYGFDRKKLHSPYVDSKDFDDPDDGISGAKKYFFWDDVHPTADVHALIGLFYLDFVLSRFKFVEQSATPPREDAIVTNTELVDAFRIRYPELLAKHQKNRWTYWANKSKIDYLNAEVEDMVRHAFLEGGTRSRDVMEALGWIDKRGKVLLNAPTLIKAMRDMHVQPAASSSRCNIL